MSSTDLERESSPGGARFPQPAEGIRLAHFIVSNDVERSRRFYADVLGGVTVRAGEPAYVALSNGWIIINAGGGPTDDKPTVTLETPPDPDRDPLLHARPRRLSHRGRPDNSTASLTTGS